jgi:hypothetical protein
MSISRHVCNCFRTGKPLLVCPIKAAPPLLKMFIHRLISLPPSMDLQRHSGVLHSLSNLLMVLLHQLWALLSGIVLWRRSAIRDFLLSN